MLNLLSVSFAVIGLYYSERPERCRNKFGTKRLKLLNQLNQLLPSQHRYCGSNINLQTKSYVLLYAELF